jgi:hypothetical protein
MPYVLIACGGFLVGVLWMDLLFDVQILRIAPEHAVDVIAGYYENATLRAYPMNRLISLIMIVTVLGAIYQLVRGRIERAQAAAMILSGSAVGLALTRVVPNAMLIGTRPGSLDDQIALARAICVDHMICLALMVAFTTTQIFAARRSRV